MAYAILRTAKLKTAGNIGGSLSHNYRTRETPNAVDERTHLNVHSLPTAELVKSAIEDRLPEKVRSNGVLCIEYFIGASPEYFDQSGDVDGSRYFETAKKWLEDKHGKENVVATTVHYDETSPHLVAYVVPIDQDTGKLNARKFLGGRATLSAMQTDFANTVKHHGLDRGVEGSKATHTTIQEYYARVSKEAPPLTDNLDIPAKKWLEPQGNYDDRVRNALREQLSPRFDVLEAKAGQVDQAKKDVQEAKETVADYKDRYDPLIKALYPLEHSERIRLLHEIQAESAKILAEKERQKQAELEAKNAKNANRKRQRSYSDLAKKKPKGQSL